MKNISILTLLSASLVAAAPFVGTGPVLTTGTEGVALPATQFGRREEAIVQDFSKRALRLRGALLAARHGQGQGQGNGAGNADAATVVVDGQTQTQAAQGKAKGKGKNANAQAAGKPTFSYHSKSVR